MDCIFCAIVNGDIPSNKVYEDDKILAFKDINPQAKVHTLVIPKTHIKWAYDITSENSQTVAYIFEKIPEIAKLSGIEGGFRIINNCGKEAGQTVDHLHFHILAGDNLSEKLV